MEAGSYRGVPQGFPDYGSTPACDRTARPTPDQLHSPRKYSQDPEGADTARPLVCCSAVGSLQQLESSQSSIISLYSGYTPETTLDYLSTTSNECIEMGDPEDESCSGDAMQSASQVNSSLEYPVEAHSVHRDTSLYTAAPSSLQTSWRNQQGGMPWNDAVPPLTERNATAGHATNSPLAAQRSDTAASFHQGCSDRSGANRRHHCEPWRLEELPGYEERVLTDAENWSHILPEDWEHRRKAWLFRQRLLEEMGLPKEVKLNEMTRLLHARHDDVALHLAFEQEREQKAIAKAVDVMQWLADVKPPDVANAGAQAPTGSDPEEDMAFAADDDAEVPPIPPPRLRRYKKAPVTDSGLDQKKSQRWTDRRQASWSKVLPWLEALLPPETGSDPLSGSFIPQ
ncbi:hypothetical protein V5799_022529 [Amblyomma americanum]|uniref:Uncharacterized protein n=1 Tax=Amblyomma americanum TaxID=6943 RepID=A0AAQ4FLS5_AMBAM